MVRWVQLTNFRSYVDARYDLGASATVVVGPNASGKTNLLEALYVLATAGSFRARHSELVNYGADETLYRIVAGLNDDEVAFGYHDTGTTATKRATRNSVKSSLVDHVGRLHVVLFEPNDLLLIFGGPDRRRKFLDSVLVQTSKPYLKTLHSYRRVLAQRNKLLSDWTGDTTTLFAWNVQLADLAADIYYQRQRFLGHINQLAAERYAAIAGVSQELSLNYISSVTVDDTDTYATAFLAALQSSQQRDIGAGFTTIGPHRDDISIQFRGGDISTRASRGEMRTVILVLKLAELDYIEQHTNATPLLLLDDVFSELDADRRRYLIATLRDRQAVITTTDADHIIGELTGDVTIIRTGDQNA